MELLCQRSGLNGRAPIPGSKSHTIRAVFIAALAEGESTIDAPLDSADTRSALAAVNALGAGVDATAERWVVRGVGRDLRPREPVIDVGNSGTTLRVLMGTAALLKEGEVTLTGDKQIQRRPAGPLATSLNDLGASVRDTRGNGCAPFLVRGRLCGGRTTIEAATSQYVSSLLLACPLAEGDSVVDVPLLNEKPYVQITLDWLAAQNIELSHDDMRQFRIPGGQQYRPFSRRIPADFSSATFFLAAGAMPGNDVTCTGLDMRDSQPDKAVVRYLRDMGADVAVDGDAVRVRGSQLRGIDIDMNETPDALPAMAVVGCFASGETRLHNVAHARIKETDRIAVMCCELRKMGANIEERPDGLIIRESRLHAARVSGEDDHRVVMALALAGMTCDGETVIDTAEAMNITFPDFVPMMQSVGGIIALR